MGGRDGWELVPLRALSYGPDKMEADEADDIQTSDDSSSDRGSDQDSMSCDS